MGTATHTRSSLMPIAVLCAGLRLKCRVVAKRVTSVSTLPPNSTPRSPNYNALTSCRAAANLPHSSKFSILPAPTNGLCARSYHV